MKNKKTVALMAFLLVTGNTLLKSSDVDSNWVILPEHLPTTGQSNVNPKTTVAKRVADANAKVDTAIAATNKQLDAFSAALNKAAEIKKNLWSFLGFNANRPEADKEKVVTIVKKETREFENLSSLPGKLENQGSLLALEKQLSNAQAKQAQLRKTVKEKLATPITQRTSDDKKAITALNTKLAALNIDIKRLTQEIALLKKSTPIAKPVAKQAK